MNMLSLLKAHLSHNFFKIDAVVLGNLQRFSQVIFISSSVVVI